MVKVSTGVNMEGGDVRDGAEGSATTWTGPAWSQGSLRKEYKEGSPPEQHSLSGGKHTGEAQTGDFADGAVTQPEISSGAVDSGHIQDGAVQRPKIDPHARTAIFARGSQEIEIQSGGRYPIAGYGWNKDDPSAGTENGMAMPRDGSVIRFAVQNLDPSHAKSEWGISVNGGGSEPGMKVTHPGNQGTEVGSATGTITFSQGDLLAVFLGSAEFTNNAYTFTTQVVFG